MVKKLLLLQFHDICEILLVVDPSMVFYLYSGKLQHSSHVILYDKRHTKFPQLKKYKKLVSIAELKRYTERCNVYTGKSTYINFFIRHTTPMDQLLYEDIDFRVTKS